jgi:membrane associated rhomboid family serine protease
MAKKERPIAFIWKSGFEGGARKGNQKQKERFNFNAKIKGSMLGFRKMPWGAICLSLAVLIAYFALSYNTPYIADASLRQLALNSGNPLSIITHLFIHVGIFHLIGNLIPLFLFGLALEGAVLSIDVVLIFLISGMGASLLFALVNPLTPLIGASGGISGVLCAVMLLKPRHALALLIATPLLISFVIFPAVDLGGRFYEQELAAKNVELKQELNVAVAQNKTPQAIRQINQTLQKTETQIEITQEGKQREAATPTDFLVHVYGAVLGGFYVFFFKRRELRKAENDFVGIGGAIFNYADALSAWLRGKKR